MSTGREKLFLALIVVIGFIAYTYIPFTTNGAYIHPDQGETLLIARNLATRGTLVIEEPLNNLFEYPVFTRQASASLPDASDKIVPVGPPGRYLLYATATSLGPIAPSVLTAILAVAGIILYYKLLKILFPAQKLPYIAVGLLFILPSLVYWSNTVLSNVPSLTLYILSLLSAVKAVDTGERRWYTATALAVAANVYLRYEFAVVPIVMLLALLPLRKTIPRRRIVEASAVFILVLTPLVLVNLTIYGGPFRTGYLLQPGDPSEPAPFPTPAPPNVMALATNLSVEYVQRYPHLLLASLLGALLLFKGRESRDRRESFYWTVTLLFSASLFYWFGNEQNYVGFGRIAIVSSYSRYFLPSFLPLLTLAAVTLGAIASRIGTKISNTSSNRATGYILVAMLSANFLWSVGYVSDVEFGLLQTQRDAFEWRKVAETVEEVTEPDSIVVTELYSTMILTRRVLWPYRIPYPEIPHLLPAYVEELLALNLTVYLVEERTHPWYLDIEGMLQGDFALVVVSNEPRVVKVAPNADLSSKA